MISFRLAGSLSLAGFFSLCVAPFALKGSVLEDEARLEEALPSLFDRAVEHYMTLSDAATPLMVGKELVKVGQEQSRLLFPLGYDQERRQIVMRSIYDSTAGHFPGTFFLLYDATGLCWVKDLGFVWGERLAPNATADTNRDLGLIVNCSLGNARRILGDSRFDDLIVTSARTMAKRFSPETGLISRRNVSDDPNNTSLVPDNLMNLELLEEAAWLSSDRRLDEIARSHADVTMRHRSEGASCESAWRIYGYTMMHRWTKDARYLAFAQKLADFALNHPNMPTDGIPPWNFSAPGEERDSSAAACMASGLLELSTFVPGEKGSRYRAFAVRQLLTLASPAYFSTGDEIGHFLIKQGVRAKPCGSEIDAPLCFGDFYFIEALLRFRKLRDGSGGVGGMSARPQPKTAWRLHAYVHGLTERADGVYETTFCPHRLDVENLGPLKFSGRGVRGATYAFRVNGHAAGVVSGETWQIEIPFGLYGEQKNKLEIAVTGAKDPALTQDDQIAISGRTSTEIGPRLSERDFFCKHVDRTVPELAAAAEQADAGDFVAATTTLARYVRRHFTIDEARRKSFLEPADRDRVLKDGARALDGWVSLFGQEYRLARGPINWQFNPTANSYIEWCWHLSYFDWMDRVVRYYVLTKDERAAAACREQYLNFFRHELAPVDRVPSYGSTSWRSLEIGARLAENLPNHLHWLLASEGTSDAFVVTFLRSVWEHQDRARRRHAARGNWLTNEMTGLFASTFSFPYFRETQEWRRYAFDMFCRELAGQVYPDGMHVELSLGYHMSVQDQFKRLPAMYAKAGVELPADYGETIRRMYEPHMKVMRPDGCLMSNNDMQQTRPVSNFLMRAMRDYPQDRHIAWFATGGRSGDAPDYLSCALPYAGWAVMRNSWATNAVWATMDCGPFGAGHQHEDKLGIQMFAYGVEMLNEGDWYDYDTSVWRKYVLSTRSHNTIRIDGCDQNRDLSYRWDNRLARVKAKMRFETTPEVDVAEGVYDEGYGVRKTTLDTSVTHARRLLFFKAVPGLSPFFVVVDRLRALDDRRHTFEQLWHLQDGAFDSFASASFVATYPNGARLSAAFSDGESKLVDMRGGTKPEIQGWNPGRWGRNDQHPIATPVCCGAFAGARRLVTVFHPLSGDPSARDAERVTAVEASTDVNDTKLTVLTQSGRRIELREDCTPDCGKSNGLAHRPRYAREHPSP